MISLADYFGPRVKHPERTLAVEARALRLLRRVNLLLEVAEEAGWLAPRDPDTGSQVSGTKGGAGDGGWRPSDSHTGGPGSKHRRAAAVDVYDPDEWLDGWLTDERLVGAGLWREAPSATPGWAHLQDEPPMSGNRTYVP